MPEALPSGPDSSGATDASSQEARIEHLLVTGLDHYFAGDFEHAINLWTRVLFLDRAHDRARAYIERARSAQAERQRQTEALVHQGLEAFDRGKVEEARALLSDAIERGAPHDLALGVLGRIDRLDSPGARPDHRLEPAIDARRGRSGAGAATPSTRPRGAGPFGLWMAVIALTAVLGVAAAWWVSATGVSWPDLFAPTGTAARPGNVVTISADPLPVPAPAERYLLRGRMLFAGGRLREAMTDLERIPLSDPLRAEADRLRGQIQRELLAIAASDMLPAPLPVAPPSRPPE